MRKGLNGRLMGVVALALVCVMAGTALGTLAQGAQAETVLSLIHI